MAVLLRSLDPQRQACRWRHRPPVSGPAQRVLFLQLRVARAPRTAVEVAVVVWPSIRRRRSHGWELRRRLLPSLRYVVYVTQFKQQLISTFPAMQLRALSSREPSTGAGTSATASQGPGSGSGLTLGPAPAP